MERNMPDSCADIVRAYDTYLYEMDAAGSRRIDAFLGRGGAARERCQDDFMRALRDAVDAFLASEPEQEDVSAALEYMLSTASEHKKSGAAYWMLLASQGMALPLIELLGPAGAAELRKKYDRLYPRRTRLPVQAAVADALAAAEGA